MFDHQQAIIERARRLISRLPGDARFMLVVTDESGAGDDPVSASLSVTIPQESLLPALDALGPERSFLYDLRLALYERAEDGLEVTVEVEE